MAGGRADGQLVRTCHLPRRFTSQCRQSLARLWASSHILFAFSILSTMFVDSYLARMMLLCLTGQAGPLPPGYHSY